MSMFAPAPEPPTPLGRHRVLSPTAGVRVSPLCLGAMSFGTAWKEMLGECDKDQTYKILDAFYQAGGNFIDTANNYQNEESEEWIGDWMAARENREEIVIATKFTTNYRGAKKGKHSLQSNYTGNNTKSLETSLNHSLKKLKTDYVDLLYVHWWDHTTSIEELMQSLNRVVQSGKVHYLGISDTPAWIVSKANQYARDHGLRQFCIYQGMWNAATRDLEEDVLPMCLSEGMAVAPWKSLGGGLFKTEAQRNSPDARGSFYPLTDVEKNMSTVLEKIANKKNTSLVSVAMAYVMHSAPDVYPIVGSRKVEQLMGNIEALNLRLSEEEMNEIREASGFQLRFPNSFVYGEKIYEPNARTPNKNIFTRATVHIDSPVPRQPVFPPQAK